jgi:type II secretory pathway component PulF
MKCPKCGHEQVQSAECVSCGIFFAKFEKRLREKQEEEESQETKLEESPATTPRPSPVSMMEELPRPMTTGAFKVGPSISSIRDLCHGMSRMLRAGQPVADSLRFLSEHSPQRLKQVVNEIVNELVEGKHLSQAMAQHPHVFPPSSVQLVRAAERTGHLSEAFLAIGEALEARLTIRRHLVRSLLYPFFVLLMSILLLPLPKLITGDSGSYLSSVSIHIVVVLMALFLCFVVVPRAIRLTTLGYKLRTKAWSLPWPATLYQAHARSVLCRVFGRNLKSGLPVYESLESAALTTLDPHVQRTCASAAARVANGESLTQSIAGTKLLQPEDGLVLTTGETTGELPGALDLLADRYAQRVQQGVRVLLIIASSIVALIIFAFIFMSILDAYQGIFSQADSIIDGLGIPKLDMKDMDDVLYPKNVFKPLP